MAGTRPRRPHLSVRPSGTTRPAARGASHQPCAGLDGDPVDELMPKSALRQELLPRRCPQVHAAPAVLPPPRDIGADRTRGLRRDRLIRSGSRVAPPAEAGPLRMTGQGPNRSWSVEDRRRDSPPSRTSGRAQGRRHARSSSGRAGSSRARPPSVASRFRSGWFRAMEDLTGVLGLLGGR